MDSVEYGNLDTVGKRAVILDFYFKKFNELKEFTFIKPKDIKAAYKLKTNQHRTLNRNFELLYAKFFLKSELEEIESDKWYHTAFKINDTKIKYKIPMDETKIFHYAYTLASYLTASEKNATVDNISFFKETALNGMGYITKLSDGIFRDVLLASKIYEYFDCKKGDLLSIVAELSHFEQPIKIRFKDGTVIENGVINSIGIYEDGEIDLIINDETIEIKTIDEIIDIFVVSSNNFPTLSVGLPKMNTQILLESLKNQPQYGKMVEIYNGQCIDTDFPNDSLEKFIIRLCKRTENCLSLTERATKKIILRK